MKCTLTRKVIGFKINFILLIEIELIYMAAYFCRLIRTNLIFDWLNETTIFKYFFIKFS